MYAAIFVLQVLLHSLVAAADVATSGKPRLVFSGSCFNNT